MKYLMSLLTVLSITGCVSSSDEWQAYPEKIDMLAIFAHPDDEGYWGGLLAYYATCQQKSVVMLSLTSGEWGNGLPHPVEPGEEPDCSFDDSDYPCFPAIPANELVYPNYYRETELANAARIYGINCQPVTPRYKDMNGIGWDDAEKGFEFWGGREEIIGYLANQIRRFKPDVVVGLDWNGANGNPQHAAAAQGAYHAAVAAADANSYPGQFTSWQVKKMYSHLRNEDIPENPDNNSYHHHDWELPCAGNQEVSARALGAQGNAAHVSQEMKEECDPFNAFVLKLTTVGPDLVNQNNLFENL